MRDVSRGTGGGRCGGEYAAHSTRGGEKAGLTAEKDEEDIDIGG